MINREAIFVALFNKVSAAAGLVTTSRKLAHWSDVPGIQQPALFQAQGKEMASAGFRLPTKWTLRVHLYVYVHQASVAGQVPATQLNTILDAIETALLPDAGSSEQTLGGLVSHCRIVGEVETDEGTLGDQAVAIIPIEIQANA